MTTVTTPTTLLLLLSSLLLVPSVSSSAHNLFAHDDAVYSNGTAAVVHGRGGGRRLTAYANNRGSSPRSGGSRGEVLEPPGVVVNVARGGTIKMSSTEESGCRAEHAIDGRGWHSLTPGSGCPSIGYTDLPAIINRCVLTMHLTRVVTPGCQVGYTDHTIPAVVDGGLNTKITW
jgi:hypothetical protein